MHCTRQLRQRFHVVDTVVRLAAERARDERSGQCAFEAGRHDERRRAGARGEFVGCQRQVLRLGSSLSGCGTRLLTEILDHLWHVV